MGRKRIFELDEELAILDDDQFVFDREISAGVWKTFRTSALAIYNYTNDLPPPSSFLLLETGDFILLETGDKIILG